MKELKTLKDLEEQDYLKMENEENFVSTKKIKQEAIKHYKAVKNGSLVMDVPTYIRWANDLTEAELKNERQI